MIIAYVPLAFALLGLVLYLAADGKPSEIGRILFFAGIFAFALSTAHGSATIQLGQP